MTVISIMVLVAVACDYGSSAIGEASARQSQLLRQERQVPEEPEGHAIDRIRSHTHVPAKTTSDRRLRCEDVGSVGGSSTLTLSYIRHRPLISWFDRLGILFGYGSQLQVVNSEGTRLWVVTDTYIADEGNDYSHADYSPARARLAYTSCQQPVPRNGIKERLVVDSDDRHYYVASTGPDGLGREALSPNRSVDFHFPAWSPDGTRVAMLSGFRRSSSFKSIHVIDTEMGSETNEVTMRVSDVLNRGLARHAPQWSPDGESLIVLVEEGLPGSSVPGDMRWGVYTIKADGSRVQRISGAMGAASWSPDGRRLAFATVLDGDVVLVTSKSDGSDVQVVTTITDRATFVDQPGNYDYWSHPHPVLWSPDGAHLLHVCDAGVCVVDLAGQRIGASPAGLVDDNPDRYGGWSRPAAAWSPDGSRIAVRTFRPFPRYGDPILFTMAPDGSRVDVLVRAGLGAVGTKLRSVGTNPGLVAANSDFRDIAGSRAACTAGYVVAAPVRNPGLVEDCETLIGLRNALFGASLVTREYSLLGPTPTPRPEPTPTPTGALGSESQLDANPDRGWSTARYVVSNWGPGTPIDQWIGVTVSGSPRRVTAVQLSYHGFSGSLPAVLGQLAALTHLDLSGHQLTGPIPAELGQLAALTNLDLSHNQLAGPIPAELGRLANLIDVRLAGNQLSGCVPPGLPVVDRGELGLPDCEAAM